MERFQLTAHLQTPIIIGGGYLTLDALLGSILFEQLQDVEEAHAQIPLVCADGLFHGVKPPSYVPPVPETVLQGGT